MELAMFEDRQAGLVPFEDGDEKLIPMHCYQRMTPASDC
jgi:hypothetical protein